jgi:hypothetical protein
MVRRSATDQYAAQPAPTVVRDVLRSPGQALDVHARAFFEPRFGYDFSQVRVHSDPSAAESARAVNAHAYTVGRDIVFDAGQYAPHSAVGRNLLAHELTHVVQQSSGTAASAHLILAPTESSQEKAADSVSARISAGDAEVGKVSATAAGALQRQPATPSAPPTTGGLNLTFDLERGRVDLTVSGPSNTPVVSKPTIGLRRDPSGQYHLLLGGKDKVVTIDEIPALLRSAVGGPSSKGSRKQKFRIPTCGQLQLHSGKEKAPRYMTFDQYKFQQKMFHSAVSPVGGEAWMELTKPLFDALIEFCSFEPKLPPREPPVYQDAPERVLPPGSAYA